eukprot:TRINITY_DN19444_c0_g2_i1.p1 TRINITY_DN19444_c0_g2~~TRINITY_DN19444_c0_g2_i1.p1  ORF type:complete len:312 (-),score=-18.69 TRINITY_DN19444_c0_g2_i1:182-1051(-)
MAQTLPLTRAGCASLMRPPVRSGSANRRPSGHPCLSAARIDSGARAESVEWSANGVAAGRGFAAMLPARPVHSRRAGRGSAGPVALFTGIVEEMGAVRELRQEGADGGWVMRVDASVVLEGVHLGDSIAVNGTCLTVTEFDEGSFVVGLAPETLRRTNLGSLTTGSPVNLERSLRADQRLGGHFVQGHVDGTGTIIQQRPEGDSLWITVQCDPAILRYVVPKGYIAVDGTSLTVVEVNDEEQWFTFMLVAYTQQKIIIPQKKVGDAVNLEVDIVGKYVERVVAPAYKQG